jgi:hypothetical protein
MLLAKKLNKGAGIPAPTVDGQFNYVTMLLHGDGTNGTQNNTFIDSSSTGATITRNGNTTQGSFSPYGSNWSNFFDGNGDYLTAANNAALDVGTGAFTIEGWIYRDGTGDADWRIVAGSVSDAGFFGGRGTLSIGFGRSAVAWDLESTSNVYSLNTWTHVVYVRNGSGNLAIFANGTRVATTTNSNNYGLNGGLIEVGAEGANQYFGGYISNVRLVKGTAVYDPTESTLTVPTTPLTAVSGTGLLTCQSNRFIDNSSSPKTLTVNGTPSVQRFNPFGTATAYSTSVIGGSAYFDGASDYLKTTGTVGIANSAFTICCWFYPLNSSVIGLFDSSPNVENGFRNYDINTVEYQGGGTTVSIAGDYQVNAWNWLCITKSGTSFTVYINGTSAGSGTCVATMVENQFTIGAINNGGDGSYLGYISDFQVLNTATIVSVPTAPITNASGKTYLLNFTNGAIFDNAMMNDLETVGNAQISTSVKKYGTGSMYFDGTGDYLIGPSTPNMNFGSGDFTVEAWVYRQVDSGTTQTIYQKGRVADSNFELSFVINTSNKLEVYYSTSGTSATLVATTTASVSQNTWTHVAVSRSGSTWRVFIGGTLDVSATASVTLYTGTARISIATNPNGDSPFTGYIDDFRITKGYARYTATFTPPTSALSDTGPY